MKIKGQTKKKEKRRRRRRRRKKERKEENSFHVGRRVAVHSAGRQSMVCQELCVNDRTVERRNRLGCISHKDHVTNKEVYAKIQQAIGPHKDLLAIAKKCKLQWYGHVSRSLGLAKTTLQGTVKGGRRQGRQRKMWEDNVRKWTGLEFAKSQRAV